MTIEIVIPVLNEEGKLASSIASLHRFLSHHVTFDWRVIIADNGSTDSTPGLIRQIERQYARVRGVRLDRKGRGRALKQVWRESSADILSYMDVDLSTDLIHFPSLVGVVASGRYDVAIGSRLLRGAVITRSLKREWISRTYNWLLRVFLHTRVSDAQCGFKAITRQAADALLPLILSDNWFFDTELLVIAETLGLHIFELPVKWAEQADSRVKIVPTVLEDIRGIIRMRWAIPRMKMAGCAHQPRARNGT